MEEQLRSITFGVYQLKLSSSYIQEYMDGESRIYVHKDENNLMYIFTLPLEIQLSNYKRKWIRILLTGLTLHIFAPVLSHMQWSILCSMIWGCFFFPFIGDYVRIVCAISNRYFPALGRTVNVDDDIQLAREMQQKSTAVL
jgi:hypothetical protein